MDKSETSAEKKYLSKVAASGRIVNGPFVSRKGMSAMNGIKEALTDTSAFINGVHRTETVAMFDLVEKVSRRAHRDNLIDMVKRVSFTRKPDFKRIQEEIAAALGFTMNEKSEAKRAALLQDRIKMEQKIPVVLQDLNHGLDFGRLRIPFGEDHRGRKILLASTTNEIISSQMHAHKGSKRIAGIHRSRQIDETSSMESEMGAHMAFRYTDVSEISEQRTSAMNGIMKALIDASAFIIGVWGTETATMVDLVEKVSRRVDRDNLFDKVIRISVTRKQDFKRNQGEIAAGLGFTMKEKSEDKRAALLRDKIKMERKILVMLEDVNKGLDLGKLGIPFGDDHIGCKILLTSTSQEILSYQMHAHKIFHA